jgi:hypothetical protein
MRPLLGRQRAKLIDQRIAIDVRHPGVGDQDIERVARE